MGKICSLFSGNSNILKFLLSPVRFTKCLGVRIPLRPPRKKALYIYIYIYMTIRLYRPADGQLTRTTRTNCHIYNVHTYIYIFYIYAFLIWFIACSIALAILHALYQ
jgi:hypothetical protein